MAFRQVDNGGVEENVFVDDRCPTVWQASRLHPSTRYKTQPLQPRTQNRTQRDVALLSSQVRPIEGDLLRKLFKATVEEKKRASEDTATASPRAAGNVPQRREIKSLPGFRLPAGVGTPRPRVQALPKVTTPKTTTQRSPPATPAAKKETTVSLTSTLPTKSRSVISELVLISGGKSDDAGLEALMPPPSDAAVSNAPTPPALDVEEKLNIPVIVEEFPGQRKNKKQNRKNKKAQAREQKRISKQAGVNAEVGLVHDQPADDAPNDDHDALMSGALPNVSVVDPGDPESLATVLNNGLEALINRPHTSRASSKRDCAEMQPTVESVASYQSTRASKASKPLSTTAPSARTIPTGLSSISSFEEVGEAWVGPVASPIASTHSVISRSPFMESLDQDFEDHSQHWIEPDDTEQISIHTTPLKGPCIHTASSAMHSSPRAISKPASASDREELHEIRLHRNNRHSVRSGSRSPSTRMSHTIMEGSSKTVSRGKSSRQSCWSQSWKQESRHDNSPSGVQSTGHSPKSSHPSSLKEQQREEYSIQERKLWRADAKLGEFVKLIAGADHSSTPRSQPARERSNVNRKPSQESSHSSQVSPRISRHASTRSLSHRDTIWEGRPSIGSPSRGGSRRSMIPCLEAARETGDSRRPMLTSVIGSLASLIFKVRSDVTFEQVGDGWHNGGVPSDELKRSSSEAHSSTRSSSHNLRTISVNENEDNEERLDQAERRQSGQSGSRSNGHSHHRSSVPTHRSHRHSRHGDHHTSTARISMSQRSGSATRARTLVGAPVHAVVSHEGRRSGNISSHENHRSKKQEIGRYPQQRPTIFAGRGWITPHPLESSVTEKAPAIVLPSHALPKGGTMSYEEYKAIQEHGIRHHRNFSLTESDHVQEGEYSNHRNFSAIESDQSGGKRHKSDHYLLSGWKAESWQEVEPPTLDPNAASTHVRSKSEASEIQVVGSEARKRSDQDSHPSQRSSHREHLTVSPSERAWERMEEGDAGCGHREDSLLSGKESVHASSVWN